MKRAWLITNRHYLCYYYIHVYFKGKLGEEVLDTTNMYYINLEMLYVQLYGPFKLKLFNPEGIMMNLYIWFQITIFYLFLNKTPFFKKHIFNKHINN